MRASLSRAIVHEDVHCGPSKSSPTGNPGTKEGQVFRVATPAGYPAVLLHGATSTRDEGASGRRVRPDVLPLEVLKSRLHTRSEFKIGPRSIAKSDERMFLSIRSSTINSNKVNEFEIVSKRKIDTMKMTSLPKDMKSTNFCMSNFFRVLGKNFEKGIRL